MDLFMRKDFRCNYSILDRNVICEHKVGRYNAAPFVALHNHDGYEIVLFLGGECFFCTESERKKLERGDLVLVEPYAFHGADVTDLDSYERIVVNIREEYLGGLGLEDTDLSACFYNRQPNRLNLLKISEKEIGKFVVLAGKIENNMLEEPYGYRVLEKAYLAEFMVLLNQKSVSSSPAMGYANHMPEVVSEIFRYVEQNLTSDISIGKIAAQFHHNSDYLSRMFKSVAGCSLQYYIIAKRISAAQSYLREGESPYDVCFMSGFHNYSSFFRAFSRQVGCSPKQYQQEYLAKSRSAAWNR